MNGIALCQCGQASAKTFKGLISARRIAIKFRTKLRMRSPKLRCGCRSISLGGFWEASQVDRTGLLINDTVCDLRIFGEVGRLGRRDRMAAPGHRTAVTTCALMRPSIAPLPNRCASASVALRVASSSLDGSRASISLRSGVPWQ